MMSPNRPTSPFRLFSTPKFRITLLLAVVAITATVLSSNNSFASSLGQRLFAGASAIFGGNQPAPAASSANHALSSEIPEAAAAESSTMSLERRGHTATRLADGRVL